MSPLAWKLIVVTLILAAAYGAGFLNEKHRFDDYKRAVEIAAKAQEKVTKDNIARQLNITKAKDEDHEKALKAERTRNAAVVARLRANTNRSVLPPVSPAAEGGPRANTVCFERDKLDRGIQSALAGLLEGTAGVLQRGDDQGTAFLTCATWVLEQWRSGGAKATSP